MSDPEATLLHSKSSPAPAASEEILPPSLPAKQPPDRPTTTASAPPALQLSPRPLKHTPAHLERDITTKLARNVSPALLARMKFLNQGNDANNNKKDQDIGRLDEDEIRRLDAFHKRRSLNVERRGTAWSGIGPPPPGYLQQSQSTPQTPQETPLIPQSTGESVPPLAMEPDTETESDHSSVVSTSDKLMRSESEAEGDDVRDMQKYRLPDITKTKSLSMPPTEVPSEESTRPPTPPPKDPPTEIPQEEPAPPTLPEASPPPAEEVSVLDDNGIDIESYFQRRHFPRAQSIYTLSKASFSNQIQQLTSMKLPPTTIASEITSLPSSTLAGRALHKAANDIRLWMAKAADVLDGLDAEDDVEWAAAAGREGLEEVDAAVGKFEGLVTVYIGAIEDLQARPDISTLPNKDQTTLITQMEEIVNNWAKIKQTLKGIKNQVEIAMEWEELWNNVLGEIGAEVENLSRLVFEMEERRHRVISDSVAESAEKFDIADLETVVEQTPRPQPNMVNKRFSMPPLAVVSPISPIPQIEHENTRLLALFAKLQPLRASLDFLPMRLASFQARATKLFPSACDELSRRKEQLEDQEKKLEADADALREELGEDKWVHSFRQAGSKAVAMYESCMKSVQRLTEAIEEHDEENIEKRIAMYKDKRDHYPPSMKRVLELIDIEMKHRSTVNGEILRIQQDVRQKFVDLESVIKDMDAILDEFTASRKLRDSVSTVLSARTEASSAVDTPNSSPASSVVMSRKGSDTGAIPYAGKKSRQSSVVASKPPVARDNRRYSSLPMSTPKGAHISSLPWDRYGTAPSRSMIGTPTRSESPRTERPAVKPRWNSSVNMNDTVVGHNFKPLTLTTPSPYRKSGDRPPSSLRSLSSMGNTSNLPVRSPLSRSALSPAPTTRPASTTPSQQARRRSTALSPAPTIRPASTTPSQQSRRPLASPMHSPSTPAKGKLPMRSTPRSSTPASSRQVPIAEEDDDAVEEQSPAARRANRPPSVMNSRRSSMLITAKPRTGSSSSLTPSTPGRSTSRLGNADGRASRVSGRQSSAGDRPGWR
jgi:hypothetical protein